MGCLVTLSSNLLLRFYVRTYLVWAYKTRCNFIVTIGQETEEVLVQLELMSMITAQHSPFTLMGCGLFHLAFGAILTGSAVGMKK